MTLFLCILSFNLFSWAAVDVCVIGGGAAGTYAAIKSKDLGKTVVIVERQDRLGGHTKTYVDPYSKRPIELGVAEYSDTSIVRSWFARFGIPLFPYNPSSSGLSSKYADFQTGQVAVPKTGNLLSAWAAFQKQVTKYPALDDSLANVPFPVPSDLLLPFGKFITKYDLQDAVPYLSLYGQGWGNFVTLPTLLAIKYFPPSFFNPPSYNGTGLDALAAKDNSLIYEKARKELGPNVLLNSNVLSMDRGTTDLVQITVQTPSGKKVIRAKKLISTIPPCKSSSSIYRPHEERWEFECTIESQVGAISDENLFLYRNHLTTRSCTDCALRKVLNNLKGFDLDKHEISVFNKFQGHSWYVGLVKNSGVPDNVTLMNYGTNNAKSFYIPVLPAVSNIYATVVPDLHYFLFEGNDSQPTFTQSQVKISLENTLTRLRANGTIPKSSSSAKPLEIIDFSSHTPYELFAPSDEIAKGFYNKLFALQGKKNTYWSGAAFVTHSSALIWNYTDQLVTKMWADESGNAK